MIFSAHLKNFSANWDNILQCQMIPFQDEPVHRLEDRLHRVDRKLRPVDEILGYLYTDKIATGPGLMLEGPQGW